MAQGSGLRNVLAALERHGSRVRSHGGYQTAQCPAHDDRNASLSITQGDKGAVLNCHARCDTGDILAALELNWPDVFDNGGKMNDVDRRLAADLWMPCQNPKSKGGNDCPGHKAAEYRYTDENGVLLYAVARCSRKGDGCQGFRQWVPDPTKPHGKTWRIPEGTRRVLYRLAEVLAAAKAGKRIFLMEGEKDADRMKADYPDEVATTIAAGAGRSKWKPEYCRYFRGASEVIIIADCDKTGLEYAEEVHRSLSGVVKTRVVCSPLMTEGADFSDHRDHGFTLDEFEVVPFEPISKRPDMVIQVEERDREKNVVFSGYSQESVERSLVGSMLKYGHSYKIAPIDIVTDARLKIAVQAAARLANNGRSISPEDVALEIEEMGVSTYDNALPELLKVEKAAFSDTEKPKVAARILRERTMRTHMASWLNAAKRRVINEAVDLGVILDEMRSAFARHAEEYVDLSIYCEPVGDAFSGDVLEEIVMDEVEEAPKTNVRAIRPQVVIRTKEATAQGG
jgi:hypothetical protein